MFQVLSSFILLLSVVADADVFLCAGAAGHEPATAGLTASAKPTAAQNTAGTRRAVAIFAKFKGEALEGSPVPEWARDIFNAEKPGSFSHFFDTMSFGALRVRGEVAARRYESAHRAGHYLGSAGEHGRYADFVSEILQDADRDIDFSLFDNDGPDGVPNSGDDDGFVDVVFIIPDSVPENFIIRGSTGVGHLGLESDFTTKDDAYGGTSILISPWQGTIQKGASYSAAIGALCHEYGHVLGLPDLYNWRFLKSDEPLGPEEDSAGIGAWGLMGWGARGWNGNDGPTSFSAWSRLQLGWANVSEPPRGNSEMKFEDVGIAGAVYKLPLTREEYFLLEYRTRGSTYYDRNVPGGGILIWHAGRKPGDPELGRGRRIFVDLECADGRWRDAGYPLGVEADPDSGADNLDFWAHDAAYASAHAGNLGDATDVFDGATFREFTTLSNPGSYSEDGRLSVDIRDVRLAAGSVFAEVLTVPPIVEIDNLRLTDEDGDGFIVADEPSDLRFDITNTGQLSATGLILRLSTQDPLLHLPLEALALEDLGVGQSRRRLKIPSIRFSPGFVGDRSASIIVEFHSDQGVVGRREIPVTAISPRQRIESVTVLEQAGDGDGAARTGEIIRLLITLRMDSEESLIPFRLFLRPLDPDVVQVSASRFSSRATAEGQVTLGNGPEFLLLPGVKSQESLQFELEMASERGNWLGPVEVPVMPGGDRTPPRVGLLQARQNGPALRLYLPEHELAEASPIASASVVLYSTADSLRVAQVPLTFSDGRLEGRWENSLPGAYLAHVQSEDSEGNKGRSRNQLVLVHDRDAENDGLASVFLNKGRLHDVAFSMDGGTVAVGSSTGVWLYDATALRIAGFLRDGREVRSVALSPDGRYLATGDDEGIVRIWDLISRQVVEKWESHDGGVFVLAFSPDGNSLASGGWDEVGGYEMIRVWRLDGKPQVVLRARSDVRSIAFDLSGRWILTGTRRGVDLWDTASWERVGSVRKLASPGFNADGEILVAREGNGPMRLWRVQQLHEIDVLDGTYLEDSGSVPWYRAVFSRRGGLLAATRWSSSTSALFWDVEHDRRLAALEDLQSPLLFANGPEDRVFLAGSSLSRWRVWDPFHGSEIGSVDGFNDQGAAVVSLVFSGNGNALTAGHADGHLEEWDVRGRSSYSNGTSIEALRGYSYGRRVVSSSQDGRILVQRVDKDLRVWDMDQGQELIALPPHTDRRIVLSLSPSGRLLASVAFEEPEVRIWNVTEDEPFGVVPSDGSNVTALAFSPSEELIALAAADGTIRIRDLGSQLQTRVLEGHQRPASVLAFNHDGSYLASGAGDGEVRVWNVATGKSLAALGAGPGGISALAFSPDGRWLATGSDSAAVRLWDARQYLPAGGSPGHTTAITAFRFSPDSERLASGAGDGSTVLRSISEMTDPSTVVSSEGTGRPALPAKLTLRPAYPNPFNSTVTIPYGIAAASHVRLTVYNLAGQSVRSLVDREMTAGQYALRWDGRDDRGRTLASGVYALRLRDGRDVVTRKVLLVK